MTCREEAPPRRWPWAFDNGAFGDWRAGKRWDAGAYERALERVAHPDFLVVPDVVAGGLRSLEVSLQWVRRLHGVGPLYLAVQDGMREADVGPELAPFAGIFIGGTLEWKIRHGATWVAFAHAHGRRCHVGRVGAMRRIAWARRIGADSIDSSLPLWSADNLARFAAALAATQMELV
jgi:hypothetical protein